MEGEFGVVGNRRECQPHNTQQSTPTPPKTPLPSHTNHTKQTLHAAQHLLRPLPMIGLGVEGEGGGREGGGGGGRWMKGRVGGIDALL